MIEEDYGAQRDAEGRRLRNVVRAGASQMGQLIDDLLAFSHLGRSPLNTSMVDMTSLAQEVTIALAADAPLRIKTTPLPAAHGDRALLRQVWQNLIGNAYKYSGKREQPQIEVGGREDGTETIYWVSDNDVGFDMRYCDKLFGRFQRLHRSGEFPSTGVGLAIVQRVVIRHKGRVWAEAVPGQGGCFYFALPVPVPAADEEDKAGLQLAAAA